MALENGKAAYFHQPTSVLNMELYELSHAIHRYRGRGGGGGGESLELYLKFWSVILVL